MKPTAKPSTRKSFRDRFRVQSPDLLRISEVCHRLSIERWKFRRLRKRGVLKVVDIGEPASKAVCRVTFASYLDFLKSLQTKPIHGRKVKIK